MAPLAEGAIRDVLQSLVKRDSELAQKTFKGEDRINVMEIAIDDICLKPLALRQPMAFDL
jgi:phosphate transport system protein